ncbi:MAG TPA: hypothetical protein VNU19_22570 [Candidatus Acidoferrum sp.]|nr:hypothetical protein [Candidatus Acidoferrum sp.]
MTIRASLDQAVPFGSLRAPLEESRMPHGDPASCRQAALLVALASTGERPTGSGITEAFTTRGKARVVRNGTFVAAAYGHNTGVSLSGVSTARCQDRSIREDWAARAVVIATALEGVLQCST